MASTIKVNNIQNQCGSNIANKCGSTVTLGASGDTITLACGASQTGFGRTGTVDWDTTAKTASFTAVSGNGYFVNTTSGAVTVTLPAGSAGDIVSLADYAATWQTNAVTVTPNGSDKIGGTNASVTLTTEGQSVTFVYVDGTQGWINTMDSTSNERGSSFIIATGGTITTCGNYKIHTFTSPGTFCVSQTGVGAGPNNVDYLVVAGGGGGGATHGGGGGAGGFRESSGAASGCYSRSPLGACVSALPLSIQGYPITVGSGGTAGGGPCSPTPNVASGTGSNSVFSTITSAGGGGGGVQPAPIGLNGGNGGSGGGSASCGPTSGTAGTGNTPPVSPPQGNPGGIGDSNDVSWRGGGGGGGATVAGTNVPSGGSPGDPTNAGPGGNGATTSISATPTAYAGGGGGGSSVVPGSGGTGGGGNGTANPGTGGNGTTNTGGGAGGGGITGGVGGSGIVIIRYKYQ